MPFPIAGAMIVAVIFLIEMFKDWSQLKADNSPLAITVGILVPVATIVACIAYIKSGKE